MAQCRNGYLKLTNNMKFTKEINDDVPFKDPSTSKEGRAPLPALESLLVHDGHIPLWTPPVPYQADFPTPGSSRTSYGSKEMPNGHPTIPAPPPRVTLPPTEREVIPTEITS
jgi:hypothetical protein